MLVIRRLVKAIAITSAVASSTMFGVSARSESAPPDIAALRAEVAQLKSQVAALKDRQQIHDTYLHYMRGFDRNDVELMRSAFWPDVQINYGKQSNTFDEFVTRHLKQHLETLKTWGHLLTNETVDINGDTAHVETYVTRLASRKSDGKSDIISGRYIDRLERRNGEWRIAMREFIPHFYTETDKDLDALITSNWSKSACGMGTWDKHDPSYRRPLSHREASEMGPACAK